MGWMIDKLNNCYWSI